MLKNIIKIKKKIVRKKSNIIIVNIVIKGSVQ
jgi:hypothetical protein